MLYPRFKSASQSHINTRGKGGSKYPPLSPPGKKPASIFRLLCQGKGRLQLCRPPYLREEERF